jgi:hypothetical protein
MKISREKLLYEAEVTGFRAEVLEKVFQLLNLLTHLFSHPFLKERLALKGGTALNLFIFNVPRLSVDIDLNYIALWIGRKCWRSDLELNKRFKLYVSVRASRYVVSPPNMPEGSGLCAMRAA